MPAAALAVVLARRRRWRYALCVENQTQTNETTTQEQGQQAPGAGIPVDAALRRLGKFFGERAQAPHLDPEETDPRPFWDACQTTSVQLARWARQLPKDLLEAFDAGHLALALSLLMRRNENEDMGRQIQRAIYASMLTRLREEGVEPGGNPFVAQALWAQLQSVAFHASMTLEPPRVKSREAIEEYTRARRNAITFREHLVQDLTEMCTMLAAYALRISSRVPGEEEDEEEEERGSEETPEQTGT